jgi:hypothetical protein
MNPKRAKQLLYVLIVFAAVLIYLISISLSSSLKQESRESREKLHHIQHTLKEAKLRYTRNESNSSLSSYFAFSKADGWESDFNRSHHLLKGIEGRFETLIATILENDSVEDESTLVGLLQLNASEFVHAKKALLRPQNRLKELAEIERLKEQNIKMLKTKYPLTEQRVSTLQQSVKKRSFQERTSNEIEKQFALIKKHLKKLQKSIDSFDGALTSTPINLLLLEKEYNDFLAHYESLDKHINSFRSALKTVEKSQLKVLVDMGVQHSVQIGRSSWDSYAEYNNESTYRYKKMFLTLGDYETFEKAQEGSVATLRGAKISHVVWSRLGLNLREKLPHSHDKAEFWVANLEEHYYHKYLIVDDDNQSISEWEEVSEEFFIQNIAFLGMQISSKSFGELDNALGIQFASPAGMAFVDNSHYGRWNRNGVWIFNSAYRYLNMFMSKMITKDEYVQYKAYYQGKQSYFGKNLAFGTFSYRSFEKEGRYKKTYFYENYTNQKRGKALRYKDIFAKYAAQFAKAKQSRKEHFHYSSGGYYGWYYYSYSDYYDQRRYRRYQKRQTSSSYKNRRNIKSSASRSRGRGSAGGGK